MKMKLLSKKSQKGSTLRRFGTVVALTLALLLADTAKSQTIFSNPVGINVAAIAAGKDLQVNGPIRFDNLSGFGTGVVQVDNNGDLSFTTLPTGTVPSGTSLGQSLLWDGSAWLNNDFLKVPNFTGGPEILEIGNTGGTIDFIRTIHYGGNVGLDLLPGTLGTPGGTWMSHGWRAIGNSNAPGENFTGTRTNWQDYAANIGMTDRNGGPEIDLNIQMQDFTVPVGDPLTNRIIFSGVSGMPPTLGVQEYATILGNGNMGIGTEAPAVKFEVNEGRIAQVSEGALGAPAPNNRWSSLGDRLPFAGGPGIISTGLRTQWDEAAINVGLTEDPTGTVPFSGLISWQDATPGAPGVGNNSLIFGARDNTNANFFERMRITWDGEVGIGTFDPTARLQVEGGNAIIAQVSQGVLGPPAGGNRWCAIGDRQPFTGGPGIVSTGLRAQWDDFAANYGLTEDGVTGTIAGLISWQDVTAGPGNGNNPLIFGSRDNTNSNFFERMRIEWNGNVGINTQNPNSKVVIRGDGTTAATSGLDVQTNSGTSSLYVSDNGLVGVFTTGALFPGGPFTSLAGGFAPPLGNVRLSVRGDITQVTGDFATSGDVYAASDARFKKDFSELKTNADWKKVLNVTAYSYKFDNTMVDNMEFDERTRYGFKAQDVNAEIPELTKMWGEALTVNYIGFVPFLTAGIQEHEERLQAVEEATSVEAVEAIQADVEKMVKENEALKAENKAVLARLEKLEAQLSGICSLPCVQEAIKDNSNTQEGTLNDQPQLFQNEPNPFGSTTTIKYYIPTNAKNAQLRVVDNSGKQLGEYQLKTGKGQLEISAGTIPAGTYNYSLYIDNQVIDTKKMVIINY